MPISPRASWSERASEHLRRVNRRAVVMIFIGAPVVLLALRVMAVANPDVEFDFVVTSGTTAALLAVLAAVVIQLLAVVVGVIPHRAARGVEPSTTFAVHVVERSCGAVAMGAALVGWLAILPAAPDRFSMTDILWAFVSVGLVWVALAVVEVIPIEISTEIDREALRFRLRALQDAAKSWPAASGVGVPLIQAAAYMVLPGTGVVLSASLGPLSFSTALGVAFLWMMLFASWAAVCAGYVVRRWAVAAMGSALLLVALLALVTISVRLLSATTPGIPAVGMSLLTLLVLSLVVLTVDVAGERVEPMRPQLMRRIIRAVLDRECRALERKLNPRCACGRPVRLHRLRVWHARRTGRPFPVARCGAHPRS